MKKKALMKGVSEEGNLVLQVTTVGSLCVHKKQFKSEMIAPSSKGKDVYANERTYFSELQRDLGISKMIK